VKAIGVSTAAGRRRRDGIVIAFVMWRGSPGSILFDDESRAARPSLLGQARRSHTLTDAGAGSGCEKGEEHGMGNGRGAWGRSP
jgi:hypothetical protein